MRDIAEKLLTRHEGRRNRAYRDTRGIWTVGIGHNIEAKPISDRAVDVIFLDDVADVISFLSRLDWFHNLNAARQACIVDMTFNLGRSGMMAYRNMIAAIKGENYQKAADEILDSKAARELPGRYNELAEIMRTGVVK